MVAGKAPAGALDTETRRQGQGVRVQRPQAYRSLGMRCLAILSQGFVGRLCQAWAGEAFFALGLRS